MSYELVSNLVYWFIFVVVVVVPVVLLAQIGDILIKAYRRKNNNKR